MERFPPNQTPMMPMPPERWEIEDARETAAVNALRSFIDAFDNGAVQLNSAEIQISDEHPPHPWHEEWLSRARALVVT